MSMLIIKKLLETQLNTTPGALPTAFENVKLDPSVQAPFQEVYFLPGKTRNPSFGDGFKREEGLMQVTLSYPLKAGAQLAITKAEVIKAVFPRGLTLSEGKVRVMIDQSSWIGQGVPRDGWYALPLSIPYIADVFP